MADKPHLNLIFIGHVDHGKSTTVGRLLYETGAITDRDIARYKELTQQFNRPTFEFAFVMDQPQGGERERNHNRHSAQGLPDAKVLLHNNRRTWTQGLRKEHDYRSKPG